MVGVLGQIIFVPLTPITNEWFSTSFYYGRQSERGVLSSSFCPQTRDDGEKLNALFFAGWMITDWGAYDTTCLVPVLARKVVHLWKKMIKEVRFGHRLKGIPWVELELTWVMLFPVNQKEKESRGKTFRKGWDEPEGKRNLWSPADEGSRNKRQIKRGREIFCVDCY